MQSIRQKSSCFFAVPAVLMKRGIIREGYRGDGHRVVGTRDYAPAGAGKGDLSDELQVDYHFFA